MTGSAFMLTLASASPRRRELLSAMGCVFNIHHSGVDESRRKNESAHDFVVRLAQDKALRAVTEIGGGATDCIKAAQRTTHPAMAILAADTIVTQGETVFGKPRDQQHALSMWQQLANSEHNVITAVCLAFHDRVEVQAVKTLVEFGAIDERQMQRYWRSGEPQDKAGAYAIQGLASAWVKLIHGSYSNVVGLPLRETNELLRKIDQNWL